MLDRSLDQTKGKLEEIKHTWEEAGMRARARARGPKEIIEGDPRSLHRLAKTFKAIITQHPCPASLAHALRSTRTLTHQVPSPTVPRHYKCTKKALGDIVSKSLVFTSATTGDSRCSTPLPRPTNQNFHRSTLRVHLTSTITKTKHHTTFISR